MFRCREQAEACIESREEMKVELKNVEYSKKLSEETPCFYADVYIDGKKAGYAKNDGHGGNTALYGDFKALSEYAETLPKRRVNCEGHVFEFDVTADTLVEDALFDHLRWKEFLKLRRDNILFLKEGQEGVFQYPKSPAMQRNMTNKTKLPAGCTNLNAMDKQEAFKIFNERVRGKQ